MARRMDSAVSFAFLMIDRYLSVDLYKRIAICRMFACECGVHVIFPFSSCYRIAVESVPLTPQGSNNFSHVFRIYLP